MDILNSIKQIAYSNQDKRFNGIIKQLDEIGVNYKVQSGIDNIIVSFNRSNATTVFTAHWDSVGTPGANDNATSCAILIELIRRNKNTKKSVDFVFTNKEEVGFRGATNYISYIGKENIKCVINLDICGVGENIVATSNNLIDDTLFGNLFLLDNIDKYELLFTTTLPPCDDCAYTYQNIPNTTFLMSTDKDLEFHVNNAINLMDTDFERTMHTVNDTMDTLTPNGIKKLIEYLNIFFEN